MARNPLNIKGPAGGFARCRIHLCGGLLVRSRRPRQLPRSLSIPESRARAPGVDRGIRPTKIRLFLEMCVVLGSFTCQFNKEGHAKRPTPPRPVHSGKELSGTARFRLRRDLLMTSAAGC
jgi:hypothetical protein